MSTLRPPIPTASLPGPPHRLQAVFLAIPREAHGIYALSLLSIITMLALSARVQSILVHLGAVAYFDCQVGRRGAPAVMS